MLYMLLSFLTLFSQDVSATTVAILDFTGSVNSKLYTDSFRSGILSEASDIKMISRENILLFEMEMLNCSLEQCEVEIAQQLGTDYLISGYFQKLPHLSDQNVLSISVISTHQASLIDTQQMILEQSEILDDISQFGQRIAQKHFISPSQTQTSQNKQPTSNPTTMIQIDTGGHFGIRKSDGHRSFVVLSQSVEVDIYESGRVNRRTPFEIFQDINQKSRRQNLQECYNILSNQIEFIGLQCNGWRLPTSMEWEYLATAGQDFPYSGSGNASSVANYMGNTEGYQDGGRHKANAFGLYDMSGNLWEMVWNDGDRYTSNSILLMGGSYKSSSLLREQEHINLYSTREDVGYRLLRNLY